MSISENLKSAIDSLRSAIPELRGAIVASSDGLAIAHSMAGGDPNRMAAMVATALGLGKRISDAFGSGNLTESSFLGDGGQVFVYSAGAKGVLAVVAPSGSNVGLINIEARNAAKSIAGILN